MKNIEIFNLAVGEILGQCYASFPNRIKIVGYDIGKGLLDKIDEGVLEVAEGQQAEVAEILVTIGSDSVTWLHQAGYLWIGGGDDGEFYEVTLTPKALEILNQMPKSLESQETLGDTLSKGVAEAGKDLTIDAIKSALSYGASLILG